MSTVIENDKKDSSWIEKLFSLVKKISKKIWSFFSVVIEKATSAISIACWICVIVLCIITVSICLSYIQLATQNITFLSTFKLLNKCSQFLNFNKINSNMDLL